MEINKFIFAEIIMAIIIFLDIYSKIPQIRKLVKYKNSSGISLKYYLLWNLSCLLYIIYCLLINELPLLVETSINLILNTIIFYLANKYK